MKRPLAYITAGWLGGDSENAEQAARYCRAVYEAGFSPICPTLYLPLFLNDAVPEEHKSGIDMSRDLLRRSHVLVVCGHTMTEAMKNDIAVAQRLGITAIYVEDMEAIDVPEHLLNYFDYEAYGRDIRINEDGHFAPGGYVLNNGGKFIEHYHGIEDIPAEHRVFSYPKLSIREQMAAYKEIIDGSSLEGYRKLSHKEREER